MVRCGAPASQCCRIYAQACARSRWHNAMMASRSSAGVRLRRESDKRVHESGHGLMGDTETAEAAQHRNASGLIDRLHHQQAHLVR